MSATADSNDDPYATHTASPSTAEPSSGETSPLPRRARERPSAAAQPRDPDRYLIIGEHGRGGLGRVSRAHDLDLGRDVAIKELISRGPISEVRFLREAMITARLEHPGIVPVHEAGRWPDGTPFYAMKLVAGRPLRDLIAERLTVAERIGLLHHVIAVADAIAYAHGRNIIHRDLKPANVIVGDFGETIVIDWGLAKDLSTTEDSTIAGGPFRANGDNDLTAAGAVLGTPAYMAPEQERGEHVDQRADVFAIGAMLWELCSLQKVPPADTRLRHRMLRRAGIDQDLVTIVDKALDPDARRRYPDASALAADLKAFKSGARIAARSYSLFATLAHWTRRHRALALSSTAGVALAIAGGLFYVRNIAMERDRADAALARVEATQNDLAIEHAGLTLKHAQLLQVTDPSASLDSLATYQGTDYDRADQLRAEAVGKGAALLRAVPHTDLILWLQGVSDGGIISLSTDGTVSRTAPNGTSVVIARDVASRGLGAFAYAPALHLLAYICDPKNLCLIDILHGKRIPVSATFQGVQLTGLDFSPNGTQLALLSSTGLLRILDFKVPEQPVARFQTNAGDVGGVLFIDEHAIVVGTRDGLKLVRPDNGIQTLVDPEGTFWAVSHNDHKLVFATTQGEVHLADTERLHITERIPICHGSISGVKVIPGKRVVAFACREGTVGTWDPEDGTITPRAHLDGHASLGLIDVSPDGDYIIAAGDNGVLTAVDLRTNLVTSFRGHGFRLTAISPPTSEYPLFLSADARGGIRAWPLPNRLAQVVGEVHTQVFSAASSEPSGLLIIGTRGTTLMSYSTAGGITSTGPHSPNTAFIENSTDGLHFATYGVSSFVETWSFSPLNRRRVFDTHHGVVSHVAFVNDADDLVTSGRDGRLVQWTAGNQRVIHQFDRPISTFVLTPRDRSAIVGTDEGSLWRVIDNDHVASLRSGTANITRMLVLSPLAVGIGYANGDVIMVDTVSWQQTLLLHANDAIRDIAATNDGRTIAIASNDDTIYLGVRQGETLMVPVWIKLTAKARKIALTQDGMLIAVCSDGAVWMYSSSHRVWTCLLTGTVGLLHIVLADAEKTAVVIDADGRVLTIDLEAARRLPAPHR